MCTRPCLLVYLTTLPKICSSYGT